MQELRLVAVSEDGRYLVLATAGRGTRFTLPVDERLQAAVRGQLSRLGHYEIEVESPLRPKEIQARIRAGETAEEIAEAAGVPVERIRWFEGPVLQERAYIAQQAQRIPMRRTGDTTPGPPLGEIVEERLRAQNIDPDDGVWDSWKREDGTWRVRLHFQIAARPVTAEWSYHPQRRHVTPLDDEAERLSSLDPPPPASDTVTPLARRRAPATELATEESSMRAQHAAPPEPAPPTSQDAGQVAERGAGQVAERGAGQVAERGAARPAPPPAEPAAKEQPQRPARRSGRNRRASVPSWDEIMFGARRE